MQNLMILKFVNKDHNILSLQDAFYSESICINFYNFAIIDKRVNFLEKVDVTS